MKAIRVVKRVGEDRKLVIKLPADVPIGDADVIVLVGSSETETGDELSDWLEQNSLRIAGRLCTRDHVRSLRVNCVHGGYMHLSNHTEQPVP